MKLAKILTDEADELMLRMKTRPSEEALSRVLTFTHSLSSEMLIWPISMVGLRAPRR